MEPKFVNQFAIPFEMYKEWAENPVGRQAIEIRKKYFRRNIVGCAASVVLIISGIIMPEYYISLIGAAFVVVFLLRLFYTAGKVLRKQYDMILKSQPQGKWIRTFTFSETIVVEEGRSTSKFEYKEMQKVTEDAAYFYLFSDEDRVLRVRKDSFTLGSPDDFGKFIYSAIKNKEWNIEAGEDDLGL